MPTRRTVTAALIGGAAVAAVPAVARVTGERGPRPQLTPLPDAEARGALVWHVAAAGYRAEEYLIAGRADVLESVSMADAVDMSRRDKAADAANRNFAARIVRPAQPYASRLIVYRPADDARYSGTTFVEVLHPEEGGKALVWEQIHPRLIERGHAYVGIQPPFSIPGIKALDAARYASLGAAHPTQLWGLIGDVASLLRRPDGPLAPRVGRRLILCGYSYTGVATANFANFHHLDRRDADGRPPFDGYMPMAAHTYVRPLDVPVLRVNTQCDFYSADEAAAPRADSDAPGHRFRHYQLAGCAHVTPPPPAGPVRPPAIVARRGPGLPTLDDRACYASFPAGSRPSDFPLAVAMQGAASLLDRWVSGGAPPPHAPPIVAAPDGTARLDADGNALGGLRFPAVSVPVATYGVGHGACGLYGYTLDFPPERRRALYGDRERYVAQVGAAAELLAAQGFILPQGAATLVDRARTAVF